MTPGNPPDSTDKATEERVAVPPPASASTPPPSTQSTSATQDTTGSSAAAAPAAASTVGGKPMSSPAQPTSVTASVSAAAPAVPSVRPPTQQSALSTTTAPTPTADQTESSSSSSSSATAKPSPTSAVPPKGSTTSNSSTGTLATAADAKAEVPLPTVTAKASTTPAAPQGHSTATAPSLLTTTTATTTTTGSQLPVQPSAPALVPLSGTHKAPPTVPTAKRKLHRTVPVTQLLSDHPIIQKTVQNVFGLLEAYGPLSVGQLEYNLPPIVGERVNNQSIHDIVQVLVCMGLIHQVQDPPVAATASTTNSAPVTRKGAAAAVAAAKTPAAATAAPKPPRYCVSRGIPRADVVLPHHIWEQIAAAHEEIKRCADRRKRLKQALESKAVSPRDLLRQMVADFPEILHDPVYLTALRSFQMDFSNPADRERRNRPQKAHRTKAPVTTATTTQSTTSASSGAAQRLAGPPK